MKDTILKIPNRRNNPQNATRGEITGSKITQKRMSSNITQPVLWNKGSHRVKKMASIDVNAPVSQQYENENSFSNS